MMRDSLWIFSVGKKYSRSAKCGSPQIIGGPKILKYKVVWAGQAK